MPPFCIFIIQIATWLLFSHTARLFMAEISRFLVEVVPDFHQILRTSAALTLTLIPVAFCVCDINKLQPANRLPDYKLYFWHSNYWKLLVVWTPYWIQNHPCNLKMSDSANLCRSVPAPCSAVQAEVRAASQKQTSRHSVVLWITGLIIAPLHLSRAMSLLFACV